MNNEELQNIEEIRPAGKPLKAITYKPYIACYVAITAGIGMLFLKHWAFIVLGVFFVGIALFVLLKIKDRNVIDIYQEGVLIYGLEDNTKGMYVRYDDIVEWSAKSSQGGSECVYFVLTDGRHIYKDTFQAIIAYRQLNKLMPEKESEHIRLEKMKAEPFKWSRFLDFFKKR